MQRIEPSKLLTVLLNTEKNPEIKVILSENQIYKKIVSEQIYFETKQQPNYFSGKNAIVDFIEYVSTGNMFFSTLKCIVELPEKMTAKQWEEEKKELSRLPSPVESSAYIFAPTIYKNLIKENDFPKSDLVFLCYEPGDFEIIKCIEKIISRYPSLAKKSPQEINELKQLAIENFSGDLVSCDMHFARMEETALSFQAALAGNPEINAFHIVEAIAKGDTHLIALRLSQCESCGIEISSVFMAVVYFMKQLANVSAELEEGSDLRRAFEKNYIPYPSQTRIQKALPILNKEKMIRFFLAAPKIELQLRLQKNSFQWLTTEFLEWLK